MQEQAIWCALHKLWGDAAHRYLIEVMNHYRGVEFWHILPSELDMTMPYFNEKLRNVFLQERASFDLPKIAEYLTQHQIKVVHFYDQAYPDALRYIHNPPALLYIKGQLPTAEICIGIVGSRKATAYGRYAAQKLGKELSQSGVAVISGLARGIDGAAHRGAIEEAGGTLAVLGSGIDVIYPRENKQLYQAILDHPNGGIVSDFPLGSEPLPYRFPLRNRIISGLSQGLIVVEAALRSGALITAELALEQGRDVYAVPGPINSKQSEGTHKLLKEGAKLVTEANDVLEEYGQLCLFLDDPAPIRVALSEEEEQVLGAVSATPTGVEELVLMTGFSIATVTGALSWLEINGLVKQIVGRQYIRIG